MSPDSFLPAIVAAAVSVCTVPLSMWLARWLGMMDRPDARKVHQTPTPRLGGIAIYIGFAVGIAATLLYGSRGGWADAGTPIPLEQLLAVAGAGGFLFVVGLVDDLRSVSAVYKLMTLLASAAMVCGSGAVLGDLLFGGQSLVDFRWLSWLATMGWIISVAVAINFIDGLDGLAGGLTLLSAVVLSTFALLAGQLNLAMMPLALAGALLGFLVYNWHPARTFMGDCGSLTIGFLLASCMVLANPLIGTMRGMVLPAIAIIIPLVDTGLTVFRRHYLQRRSLFAAERGHVHHRLLDRGLTHLQAVLAIYAVSIMAVGIGAIALSFEGVATLGGLACLIPLIWGTFKLAGSVRTDEMFHALRTKRDLDRTAKQYRASFEDLQLEFHHVRNFSQWWQGVCRAAERLDFVRVDLRLPVQNGRARSMRWQTQDLSLMDCDQLQASIPIQAGLDDTPPATANLEVAATKTLESASDRLGLFSRLMTEYSLADVRELERKCRVRQVPSASAGRNSAEQPSVFDVADGPFSHLRVAIVHDFLYTYCGAERVLEELIGVFPHCDIYALFDFLPEHERRFLRGKPVTTTFLQNMPFARSKHRNYLPIMPLAIEQLDVSGYDLVISSSYLAAKGVITGPDQLHVCYCHSPARYAWDLQHQYLNEAGLGMGPKGMLARMILHYIRNWDARSALGVDHFIANSQFIGRRIEKLYRRSATVIHPPVDTGRFALNDAKRDDFYLVAGRMVPYKQTELIVRAFGQLPDSKLVVIGDGPDMERVRAVAGDNVKLLGFQGADVLIDHMQRAKALIFAAEEDFGIVPVEALSCGTPVIAYGKGGVTESVVDGKHGLFYDEQSEDSLVEAIAQFEAKGSFDAFPPAELHQRSLNFSAAKFRDRMIRHVGEWAKERWPELQPAADRVRPRTEELATPETSSVDGRPPVLAHETTPPPASNGDGIAG